MEYKNIIFAVDRGIARITINRPDARNALNQGVRTELRSAVDTIKQDKAVRVVIITGAGDQAFIAGADIKYLQGMAPMDAEEMGSTLGAALYADIENLDVPVIAMINGFCLGGGNELAMSCDIRIAAETAKFGQPEINIGIFPGGGGTQRLPRLVGWGRAKELLYTGRVIDAKEAERIGLVDKVVPPDKLAETVNALAESLLTKSPVIMKLMKKAINRGMYTDLAAGLSYEKANFALCFATQDRAEGMAAFFEKRKPQFKGQ